MLCCTCEVNMLFAALQHEKGATFLQRGLFAPASRHDDVQIVRGPAGATNLGTFWLLKRSLNPL
jgi:hypothetical protein